MHADFWHERWAGDQIGFHESQVNPLLVAHFAALGLPEEARVFLPLCGKTLDIDWLLARGFRAAGAELSPLAVDQLFERLRLQPDVMRSGELEVRRAPGVEIFVGDIFALSREALGNVHAVYDRAALIALPAGMRSRYAAHLTQITGAAPQLLVTVEYDQQKMEGPPFSVSADEVRALYGDREPQLIESHDVPGGLKGKCPAIESAWLLRPGRLLNPRAARSP